MENTRDADLSVAQPDRILSVLKKAREQLAAAERARSEPVAIVGMACRFPGGAVTPGAFWQLLTDGRMGLGPVPPERWPHAELLAGGQVGFTAGCFLDEVDRFDPAFFGIMPREACSMDPQHRLLLEITWEALADAAIAPEALKESRTGVFIGIGQNDYAGRELSAAVIDRIGPYSGTGNLFCFAPGRISYLLGTNGPSLAVDTACSSSLVATHLACQSLRTGESDVALAGGVHLMLSPQIGVFLTRARAVAPDGRCKTFDADADGFGRGEGGGLVVLRRLSDALARQDRIYALIKGSAVNHDGPSSGFTVPNEAAQTALVRRALENAGLNPETVAYVETHGTGTRLGDPIEIAALTEVFGKVARRNHPLLVGSVKTNIGHLEAAAGIAGLVKTVLAIGHRQIPPHLHLRTPNPLIDWDDALIRIPRTGRAWPTDGPPVAGVSSFGMSGTNAHLVLAAPPAMNEGRAAVPRRHLITLSARSDRALRQMAEELAQHLNNHPGTELRDLGRTLNTGRPQFDHRLAVVAGKAATLAQALADFGQGRAVKGIFNACCRDSQPQVRPVDPADFESDDPHTLNRIAESFCAGARLDWKDVVAQYGGRPISLPPYPFERRRFWIDAPDEKRSTIAVPTDDGPATWPGRRLHLPFSDEVRFEMQMGVATLPLLADHQLHGRVVVPAATWLALVLSAARRLWGEVPVRLDEVVFTALLEPGDDDAATVQLILTPMQSSALRFRIVGAAGTALAADRWRLHASGCLSRLGGKEAVLPPERKRPASSLETPTDRADAWYRHCSATGAAFGPAFRWVTTAWRTEADSRCRLGRPDSVADMPGAPIHPGLLDGCLQLAARLADGAGRPVPQVPFRLDGVRFFGVSAAMGPFHCRARRRDAVPGDPPGVSLALFDKGGACILDADHCELRPLSAVQEETNDPAPSVFTLDWTPLALPATPPVCPGEWLIVDHGTGDGAALADLLTARGNRCRVVDTLMDNEGGATLLSGHPQVEQVICLFAPTADAPMADAAEARCAGLLGLARALARVDDGESGRVWIVTRGAWSESREDRFPDPAQAALWGLARVIDLEISRLKCTCIDRDPMAKGDDLPVLAAALAVESGEDRIRLAGGLARGARIAILPDDKALERGPRLDPAACYLITGGCGALGLCAARGLAEAGAARLVLVGRCPPDASARAVIAEMETHGCRVRHASVDVADADALGVLLATIDREEGPLKGVIHAAGALADGLIASPPGDRLAMVMAPKVRGAWHLHTLTRQLPLDFFVLYSSTAALFGSRGQGIYAAANAFLDGLAHRRRVMGLSGVSINWGPWAAAGMAARTDARTRQAWTDTGLMAISPARGQAALIRLMRGGAAQAGVAAVAWDRFQNHFAHGRPPRLLDQVLSAPDKALPADDPPVEAPSGATALRSQLLEASAKTRMRLLSDHLRSRVAAIMGLAGSTDAIEPRTRLFELGLDSIAAVELKERLEKDLDLDLPTPLVFDHPTVEALTAHLCTLLDTDGNSLTTDFATDIDPLPDIIGGMKTLSEDVVFEKLIQRRS